MIQKFMYESFCKENSDVHKLSTKYVGDYNIESNITRQDIAII